MSRRKQPRVTIPPSTPRPALSVQHLSLLCQLAQDGLAALLAKGVPLYRLEAHAAALAYVQRLTGAVLPASDVVAVPEQPEKASSA